MNGGKKMYEPFNNSRAKTKRMMALLSNRDSQTYRKYLLIGAYTICLLTGNIVAVMSMAFVESLR